MQNNTHITRALQHGNNQTWVVKAKLDSSCNATIDFRVPGKPSPPPISLRGTLWELSRPHEHRVAMAFSDPTGKIAPPSAELNMWVSEPVHHHLQAPRGFTCAMCKELVPYLASHECESKCSSLWSWLQSSCDAICTKLAKFDPSEACHLAGYC